MVCALTVTVRDFLCRLVDSEQRKCDDLVNHVNPSKEFLFFLFCVYCFDHNHDCGYCCCITVVATVVAMIPMITLICTIIIIIFLRP